MCGRARCTLRADDVPRACHLNPTAVRHVDVDRYRPRYNVAPGSNVPVIRRDDGTEGCEYALHCMKWGLVPSFTKKDEKPDFYKMFNARSESVGEKASFRRLIPKNRCLVAVEGFYEWKKDGSKKQPYYIHFKDGRPLVFAALYDSWKNSEGEMLYTFTILTTSSSSALQWLHDRMPVILGDDESTALWLNGSSSCKFQTLLKPYENTDLAWYPVTPAMGKTSFEGPECIKELPLKTEVKPISSFFAKTCADNVKETSRPTESSLDARSKAPKEEPETQAIEPVAASAKKVERELKSVDSDRSPSSDTKSPAKRIHDELIADSKHSTSSASISQPYIGLPAEDHSPPKKKSSTRTAGDRQPTLFSYFGKS